MTIDCRRFQTLLENGAATEEQELTEHLDSCPTCAAALEKTILQSRESFPAATWSSPPAFSARLLPPIQGVTECSSTGLMATLRHLFEFPGSLLRPALGLCLVLGIIAGLRFLPMQEGPAKKAVAASWSFLSPVDSNDATFFMGDPPAVAAVVMEPPAHQPAEDAEKQDAPELFPTEEWSFLEPESSFSFIDDEEETS